MTTKQIEILRRKVWAAARAEALTTAEPKLVSLYREIRGASEIELRAAALALGI